MANPQEQLAAWQKAALESTLTYAQASIASAEQILKLNLEAARNSLEQAGQRFLKVHVGPVAKAIGAAIVAPPS